MYMYVYESGTGNALNYVDKCPCLLIPSLTIPYGSIGLDMHYFIVAQYVLLRCSTARMNFWGTLAQ